MPCYQSRTYSVEFSPKHYSILEEVVRKMGGTLQRGEVETVLLVTTKGGETIAISNGRATGRNEKDINDLRVTYSQAVVAKASQWAAAKGWRVQRTSENKMTLTKGGGR